MALQLRFQLAAIVLVLRVKRQSTPDLTGEHSVGFELPDDNRGQNRPKIIGEARQAQDRQDTGFCNSVNGVPWAESNSGMRLIERRGCITLRMVSAA